MHYLILSGLLSLLTVQATGQSNPLATIIRDNKDDFGPWATDPATYEVQVLYTQIDRQADGSIELTTYRWGADSTQYFYPASTVKMPAAVLALQKINELGVIGLDATTPMLHSSLPAPAAPPAKWKQLQTAVTRDTSSADGRPSVANYLRKIFLVSDNDAYNRLFEWLGPTYINKSLRQVGIDNFRMQHRVGIGGFDDETHAWLNPVRFTDGFRTLYEIGERRDGFYDPMPTLRGQQRGVAFVRGDSTIRAPFDFTHKNYLSLEALQGIVGRIVLPEAYPPEERFLLTEADYDRLRTAMRQRPRESDFPRYDKPDNYVKFWIYGDREEDSEIPDHVRILNKVGWAYGYLTDAAYIVDEEAGVEFFLTGTIHVNANRTFNDGAYEYDDVGLPFFGQLGRAVLAYERRRVRD